MNKLKPELVRQLFLIILILFLFVLIVEEMTPYLSGVLGAMTLSWSFSKKPDLSMVLNGSLAGLVGITAGADVLSPLNAIIVGYIAGLLVVSSVLFFDRLRIDDPVGAISVHLTCGIWGTLAVGIFSAEHSLITQFVGVLSYGLFC